MARGGLLEIRKQVDPDTPGAELTSPEWVAYYIIGLVGVGKEFGFGGSSVAESSGEAKNVYGLPWKPEQLEGFAILKDAGAGFHIGPWGKSASVTALSCWGSGKGKPGTPLQINFSGLGKIMGAKGASLGIRGLVGRLWHLANFERMPDIDGGRENFEFEYGVHSDAGPIHFPINGAMLEYEGCWLLDIFVATELAALSRPGCEIQIDGYADQPDTSVRNLILSRNRAITCYNYMKNILGPVSGKYLPELSDTLSEKDETAEFKKIEGEKGEGSIKDVSVPPVKIAAHGEPPSDKNKNATQYDSSLRRTDIDFNGEVTLSLRRVKD